MGATVIRFRVWGSGFRVSKTARLGPIASAHEPLDGLKSLLRFQPDLPRLLRLGFFIVRGTIKVSIVTM